MDFLDATVKKGKVPRSLGQKPIGFKGFLMLWKILRLVQKTRAKP
jgi:hypothetical protein